MLKLCRATKAKAFFLALVYNLTYFDLFEFSAAILEKGLLDQRTLDIFHPEKSKFATSMTSPEPSL